MKHHSYSRLYKTDMLSIFPEVTADLQKGYIRTFSIQSFDPCFCHLNHDSSCIQDTSHKLNFWNLQLYHIFPRVQFTQTHFASDSIWRRQVNLCILEYWTMCAVVATSKWEGDLLLRNIQQQLCCNRYMNVSLQPCKYSRSAPILNASFRIKGSNFAQLHHYRLRPTW